MLGDEFVAAAVDVVQQHLGGYDTRADARLGERVLGELFLFGTFGVFGGLTGSLLGVGAEQFQGFVKQWDVGPGQRRSLGAGQRVDVIVGQPWGETLELLRFGEQLVDQPWSGHRQPRLVQRDTHLIVHPQLGEDVVQFRLVRLVIQLFDVAVAQCGKHVTHEGFACLVMRLAGTFGVGDRLIEIVAQHRHFEPVERDDRQV